MPATHDDHTTTILFEREYTHRQVTLREEALQQALRAMAVYGSPDAEIDTIGEMLIESVRDSAAGIESMSIQRAYEIAENLDYETLSIEDRKQAFHRIHKSAAKKKAVARKLDEDLAYKIACWLDANANDEPIDHT